MISLITAQLKNIWKQSFFAEERIVCYHCGETSRKSRTVYVQFEGSIHPVCCYGCASVLKTVDELHMHSEYHNSKIHRPVE